jgi:sugar phosphate isomerase/epimerase
MEKPRIAVQMIVFGDEVKNTGYGKVLGWIKERGVNFVELSKVPVNNETMPEIERLSGELPLGVCAMNVNLESSAKGELSLADNFDELVSFGHRLKCEYFRIGMMPSWAFGKEDAHIRLANILDNMGKRLLSEGIHFYYHHHEIEFQKYSSGKYGLEILLENTGPTHLGIELDTHWLQFGGQNPVTWIRNLKGRADLVHLKDYRIVMPIEGVSGDVTNPKENRKKIVQFAEVGTVNLDMKEIINACIETNVKYLPIEQDTSYQLSPYESIGISIDTIKALGFEELF